MKWKSDITTSSPPEFFFAEAPPGARAEWLRETWEFFGTKILPLNEAVEWDYVYVEVALDVGRILIFPASSKTPHRIERAGCWVVSEALQETYEELDALDEDAFEIGLTRAVKQIASEILASSAILRTCCDSLPETLTIKVWEPAEDAPTAEGSV